MLSSHTHSPPDANVRKSDNVEVNESVSAETLEAFRHVRLIERNEYPLDRLTRSDVRRRVRDADDDGFGKDDESGDELGAKCYCDRPDEDDTDTDRCNDVSCLNFATYVECPPNCDAGPFCKNQRLQHPEKFPQLEAFKTEKKGFGVRTLDSISKASIVGEYVGEIIDQKELKRRLSTVPRHELNFYYLMLEPGIYIDARNKGSLTRFVNHSCDPNCTTEKWTVGNDTRIGVFALRPIGPNEEITFDYQWKALGSRQIKCFCGTSKCKGIIGTEGDTVENEAQKGFYRDALVDETAEKIVGRRIRVYEPMPGEAMYRSGNVRKYDAASGKHQIELEDDLSGEESPLDDVDMESRSNRRWIDLSASEWNIYVSFEGLSKDEIQKQVFSIPKKQVPIVSTSTMQSSPTETPVSTSSATPSPSLPSPSFSLYDEHGEKATKLMIKHIPAKCDEDMLRELFTIRHRPSKSIEAQLKRKNDESVIHPVKHLDYFSFDDGQGWALVEFIDDKYLSRFRGKLHNRPLLDGLLRVFCVASAGIQKFETTKRLAAQKRMEKQLYESRQSEFVEDKVVIRPYGYGRPLDWIVSEEEWEERRRTSGVSIKLEARMRSQTVRTVLHVAKALRLAREDATSAILAFHRFLSVRPMNVNEVEITGISLLHMQLKAHSRRFQFNALVQQAYKRKHNVDIASDSKELAHFQKQILKQERHILEGLHFDFRTHDPYILLDVLVSDKHRRRIVPEDLLNSMFPSTLPPVEVQKEAKHLLSEAFALPVWQHATIPCVVLAIVYVSAAAHVALDGTKDDSIPVYLPVLASGQMELHKCCVALCQDAADRYRRQEMKKKDGETLEEFDVDQFAVDGPKGDIHERISSLLSQWTKGEGYKSHTPFTLDAFLRASTSFSTIDRQITPNAMDVMHINDGSDKICADQVTNLMQLKKKNFIGSIDKTLSMDIAGKSVWLQPWPYRETGIHSGVDEKGFSVDALRELSSALTLSSISSEHFPSPVGIIFPSIDDTAAAENESILDRKAHYMALEQPLHMYSSLIESKVTVNMAQKKKVLYDVFQALNVLHDQSIVHRYVAPTNVFLMKHGAKLSGYHTMRRVSVASKDKKELQSYTLSENERREMSAGAWVHFTSPEVLLGEMNFTWRGDVWALGCLTLQLLTDSTSWMRGSDAKSQLDRIFRLCGSPKTVWPDGMKFPRYGRSKPKQEYKPRLHKALDEHRDRHDKSTLPQDARDLIEHMLQLDPMKRLSVKKLLELPFFAHVDQVDFSTLDDTFHDQRKRFLALEKHRGKRGEERKKEKDKSSDSDTTRENTEANSRAKNDVEMEEAPPLPAALRPTRPASVRFDVEEENERKEKRQKLGWGMGLQ